MVHDFSKPLRFGTTRSRNGCLYCKKRRVKCDEHKPSCGRCQARGTPCTYAVTSGGISPGEPQAALSVAPGTSSGERRALDYFIARTSYKLVGTWGFSTWVATLIQAAMAEPAIQRASIALGALHGMHESGIGSQQYALAQYGTALRGVRDSMSQLSSSIEVLLLACILFCAFECMNYHIDSAMSHLSSGTSLLLQRVLSARAGSLHPQSRLMDFLLPQMRLLDNDRMCLGAPSLLAHEDTAVRIPDAFSSLYQAQQILTRILNVDLRQLAEVGSGRIPENYSASFEKTDVWSKAFDTWLSQNCQIMSDEDVANVLPILMWRTVIAFITSADFTKGEMTWDSMLPEFEHVIDCAERFVDLTTEVVKNDEPWRHPLSYVTEPAHLRAQQTLTVTDGGKITEGLLAKLLANASSESPTKPIGTTAGIKQEKMENPIGFVLDRARSVAAQKGTLWSSRGKETDRLQIKPTFTISHGIVYPLFAVIMRCRHPSTRRRALQILEECNRHEGLWDSKLAARSAQHFIMVEESEAVRFHAEQVSSSSGVDKADVSEITDASQIPNHCRVRATGKIFLPDGRVRERFCLGWKGSLQEALQSEESERWIELDVLPT